MIDKKDGWNTDAKAARKILVRILNGQLAVAEDLLTEILDTYSDERMSAAHPKAGVQQTLNRLKDVREGIRKIK